MKGLIFQKITEVALELTIGNDAFNGGKILDSLHQNFQHQFRIIKLNVFQVLEECFDIVSDDFVAAQILLFPALGLSGLVPGRSILILIAFPFDVVFA